MDGVQMALEDGQDRPSFTSAFQVWFMIGILSFGGPAAQISLMHRVIVDEKKWLTEKQYLNALSFCMLLPGPEAMQLATYVGWRLNGVRGGLLAGLLFVLPGAVVVLGLVVFYAAFGAVPLVDTVFMGIKAAVLAIVLEALLRVSKKALISSEYWLIAASSFVAIFFLGLPFPALIALAGLYGFSRLPIDAQAAEKQAVRPESFQTLKVVALWSSIWFLPLILIDVFMGQGQILSEIGWFFSKLAVVTFGGAYAVLAYMGQDVVVAKGWLEAGQMMDGLGLAETTPGPLILVTEFVGYLAAYQQGGTASVLTGLSGAFISLWATFVPCFMWIFAGAPYIEWLNGQPRLKGALAGVTAAVVGVILNLSVWFALHVFFADVKHVSAGYLQLWVPELMSINWVVVLLALLSSFLLFRLQWKIPMVLLVSAAGAVILG